jgi:hypothetical protein
MGTRQLAQYKSKLSGNGLEVPFQSSGAPVNGTSFAGRAVVGSICIDTTNGKAFICNSLSGGPQWVVVGSQT